MTDSKRALCGEYYETRSADLLASYGYRILARRFRSRFGEIDLIAEDGMQLLFVEVRARRSRSHGGALASVDRRKQCKLLQCSAFFLNQHPQWKALPCRFDVIAWEPRDERDLLEAHWIPAAFQA